MSASLSSVRLSAQASSGSCRLSFLACERPSFPDVVVVSLDRYEMYWGSDSTRPWWPCMFCVLCFLCAVFQMYALEDCVDCSSRLCRVLLFNEAAVQWLDAGTRVRTGVIRGGATVMPGRSRVMRSKRWGDGRVRGWRNWYLLHVRTRGAKRERKVGKGGLFCVCAVLSCFVWRVNDAGGADVLWFNKSTHRCVNG